MCIIDNLHPHERALRDLQAAAQRQAAKRASHPSLLGISAVGYMPPLPKRLKEAEELVKEASQAEDIAHRSAALAIRGAALAGSDVDVLAVAEVCQRFTEARNAKRDAIAAHNLLQNEAK